jgi:hypothetical protein
LIAATPIFPTFPRGGKSLIYCAAEARENGYAELRLATHALLTENLSLKDMRPKTGKAEMEQHHLFAALHTARTATSGHCG